MISVLTLHEGDGGPVYVVADAIDSFTPYCLENKKVETCLFTRNGKHFYLQETCKEILAELRRIET